MRIRFLTFVIFLFLSCVERKEKVVFSVGGAPSELQFWEELAAQFTRENGIEVELLRRPADTDQQRQGLIIALNAKESNPDVFLMDVAWLSLFAESDWLTNLDEAVNREDFFESVVESVDLYNGNLVAVPVYMDTGLLYYRKDLLEKFNLPVPRTFDSLRKSALIVQSEMRKTNPVFYGFVWQGMQYEGLVVNLLEFAGPDGGFLNKNGKIELHRPANVKALAMMRDFIHRDRISPPDTFTKMKEEESRLYFQNGNALFERNWPYAYKLHNQQDSPVRGKTGVAPVPGQKEGKIAPALGGWHAGISRFTDKKEESLRFIRFLASRKAQLKMVRRMGWNPGLKDLYVSDPSTNHKELTANEEINMDEFRRLLKYSFARARPRPTLPYYAQISAIVQNHFNAVIADRIGEKEALSISQLEIENLLERYDAR